MSALQLEAAATVLGPLVEELVFVGGATVHLWITEPGAPLARATEDVDVICEVAGRAAYYRLGEQLRDVVTLIDGRPRLVEEVRSARPELRDYIRTELTALRAEPCFGYAVEGAMAGYGALGADRARIVDGRIDELLA